MPSDLPIRCSCGGLRGIARGVSRRRGNRVVCRCGDCQSFAYFLGGAEHILDEHGGTDIFQMSPARLEITEGSERLACMRLTPGGLMRWYASCCNSPIGNTLASPGVPFVGLIHSCVDHAADGRSREATLGPVRMQASQLLRLIPIVGLARLRGDHRRSPFFEPRRGSPRAQPRALTDGELREVVAARTQ